MAKTQPKIDDIKDLKKATITSDGLMSADDKIKLNDLVGVNTGDEDTTRIGSLINGATAKTTPADADMVGLMDSEESNNILKKLSWSKIKDTLKTYFDTLYAKLSFANIRVGGVDIVASTNEDRIEFIAGTNVTLTPDAAGKKLTIDAGGGIQTVTLASGTDNGTLKLNVDGDAVDNIPVKGLDSAAYEATSAFATAAQGTKADNALPSSSYTASDILSKLLTVDGHNSGLDADTLDGKQLADLVQYIVNSPMTYKYVPFDDRTSFGWKSGSGLIITMYQESGTNAFGVGDSYDCMKLFECVFRTPVKTDIDNGNVYPNPVENAKIADRIIWTDSPDVTKYKHKLTEGIFGSIGNIPAYNNLTTWLNITNNGVAGYALKNNSSIFIDFSGGTSYSLNLTQIADNMKMGMNYTFVGRVTGAGIVPFDLYDSRGSASANLTIDQIISFDFVKVANGVAIYRNLEIR